MKKVELQAARKWRQKMLAAIVESGEISQALTFFSSKSKTTEPYLNAVSMRELLRQAAIAAQSNERNRG